MPDDNVVVGRLNVAIDWAPAEIDLTAACWLKTKRSGETQGDLKPDAESTRALELSLGQLEPVWSRASATHDDQEPLEADLAASCADLLDKVNSALTNYVPVGNDGKMHNGMSQVTGRFGKLCRERKAALVTWPVANADEGSL